MNSIEGDYNTSDLLPMDPWTETSWNAIEAAKLKRAELRGKMSKKAREEQEKCREKLAKQEEEKRMIEQSKMEAEAKKAEEQKKKEKNMKKEQKKETSEHISLRPSKKELKLAEELSKQKQREQALQRKKEAEEAKCTETNAEAIQNPTEVTIKKKCNSFVCNSIIVLLIAFAIAIFFILRMNHYEMSVLVTEEMKNEFNEVVDIIRSEYKAVVELIIAGKDTLLMKIDFKDIRSMLSFYSMK